MLCLDILDFNIDPNFKPLSLKIDRAGVFGLNGLEEQISQLIKLINGINLNFSGDIKLNGISIKESNLVQKYIQRNSLFLLRLSLIEDLKLIKNLEYFSRLWSGESLASAAAFGIGINEDLRNKEINYLTTTERSLINFSKLLTCNSYIWWIKKELLSTLNEESRRIIDNIIDVRIKQNGAVILI